MSAPIPDSCACILRCSTHEAAGELLAALKEVDEHPELLGFHLDEENCALCQVKIRVRAAIESAEDQ